MLRLRTQRQTPHYQRLTTHRTNTHTQPSTVTAGINVQIEHHLFPSVSSDKLDRLIPIVREVRWGVCVRARVTMGSVCRLTTIFDRNLTLSRFQNTQISGPRHKKTCKEFGVDYKEYFKFQDILASVHE